VPENKVSYAGQVVVITGAARGIGAATARLVAERGGKVFALDIARDGLTALQKELSLPDNQVAVIDLGSQTSVKENIDAIYKITGRIDALINTAGVVGPTNVKVEDVKWEDFESTVRINLFGTVWLTQAVVPYMKKAKYGRIAHVASIAGKEGNPDDPLQRFQVRNDWLCKGRCKRDCTRWNHHQLASTGSYSHSDEC